MLNVYFEKVEHVFVRSIFIINNIVKAQQKMNSIIVSIKTCQVTNILAAIHLVPNPSRSILSRSLHIRQRKSHIVTYY